MQASTNANNERGATRKLPEYESQTNTQTKVLEGWFEEWYHWTAPATSASQPENEKKRKGRLTSLILLMTTISVVVLVIPIAVMQNQSLWPALLIQLGCTLIALTFNRQGKLNIAGIIVVLGMNASLLFNVVTAPGGLNVGLLPIYDLLVLSELAAIVLLPMKSVFVVAAINSLAIVLDLTLQRHTLDLTQMLADTGPIVYTRPIILQIVVAAVVYGWAHHARQLRLRAERAEEFASFAQGLAVQSNLIVEQKRRLEVSIQYIVETHRRIANGDLSARVPLSPDNVLWGLAGSLNNLLARLQQLRQLEMEMQKIQPRLQRANYIEHTFTQTHHEVLRLLNSIRVAKASRSRLIYEKASGTLLDPIYLELSGQFIHAASTTIHPETEKLQSMHPPGDPESAQQRLQQRLKNYISAHDL